MMYKNMREKTTGCEFMKTMSEIIKEVAASQGVSEEQIRLTIENTAAEGLNSPDRNIRWFWRQVPRKGEKATAEEIIAYIALIAARTGAMS